MKNILLMGLTDHEAAAVEIMIGMNWRDHRCITLKRELSLAIPEQHAAARSCEACVLDLFGLGMRKYSPANATRLMEVMAGRPAVLLTWGDGGGWLEAKLPLAKGQHIGWVGMPYTSAGLRDAIKKVKEAAERMVPPAAAAVAAAPAAMPGRARPVVSLDVEPALPAAVAEAVSIPVIASGGAGKLEHFYDGLTVGKASAVLAASLFHFRELSVPQVKEYLAERGLPVRL